MNLSKKDYFEPEFEIEMFSIEDVVMTSPGGQGSGPGLSG